jgi:chloride channel protein, CIC family
MRPFQSPLAADPGPAGPHGARDGDGASLPGPVTHQGAPQVLFANEPLAQAVRQLVLYGRDGLPVLSTDGRQLEGWVTSATVARYMSAPQAGAASAYLATGPARPDPEAAHLDAPEPLRGYQVVEVTVGPGSPAAGQPLGETAWPQGWVPVSVLDDRTLRDPDPVLTVAPGDRINLLVPAPPGPGPQVPPDEPGTAPPVRHPRPRPANNRDASHPPGWSGGSPHKAFAHARGKVFEEQRPVQAGSYISAVTFPPPRW